MPDEHSLLLSTRFTPSKSLLYIFSCVGQYALHVFVDALDDGIQRLKLIPLYRALASS